MNKRTFPLIIVVASAFLFVISACTQIGEGGVKYLEGAGIYQTDNGRIAFYIGADEFPANVLDNIKFLEGERCRTFSPYGPEGQSGEIDAFVCR